MVLGWLRTQISEHFLYSFVGVSRAQGIKISDNSRRFVLLPLSPEIGGAEVGKIIAVFRKSIVRQASTKARLTDSRNHNPTDLFK